MRLPGKKTAVQMQRWLSSRFSDRAVVLGYHKIANVSNDFYEVCVTPENFMQHLEVIRRDYYPITLTEMVSHLLKGTLPHKSVAVTFDDGYTDNLYNAKPLLERFDIPATVFISPGNLGQLFWWDELEKLILLPGILPRSIRLQLTGEVLEWVPGDMGKSRQLLKTLYDRLLPLRSEEREEIMEAIRSGSGDNPKVHQPSCSLQPAEIIQLARGGLIEIGAHTMTHPILSRLPIDEQRAEIRDSKIHLENILSKPVIGFAYPNGSFTQETEAIVKDLGFHFACSSKRDVIWRKQQIYHLPRFWPKNWDGEQFKKDLKLWLN
jgi:peptidoglycan/xylan/chitin deacetylase (PgdA/CDA1 family)